MDTPQEEPLIRVTSPFDAIRHLEGEREYWRARELYKVLGYNLWENFEHVIAKAKIACTYNGREVTNMIRAGRGVCVASNEGGGASRRFLISSLTRYTCSHRPFCNDATEYQAIRHCIWQLGEKQFHGA